MKNFALLSLSLLFFQTLSFGQSSPIQLLKENPHYFEFKGKPLALITSAEHYGAVLNGDFDYKTYLETLHREGMNYTRIFMGSYFEIPSTSFGIKFNTLAPAVGKAIIPWKSSTENGQIKYDWSSYNQSYFERLADFMSLAASLDIIVEVTLFSSIYTDEHWEMNPQNPKNRIGSEGELDRKLAHTKENGQLLGLQKAYIRKLVNELNDFDNFFFEIQNEPWSDRGQPVLNIANKYQIDGPNWMEKVDYADQLSMDWQEEIAATIVAEEKNLPKKHLIAQNYSNFKAPLYDVSEHISIVNFHYNWPESAEWNLHLNRVIGFDESGFAGTEDLVYRRQAWAFMLAGGGLYNNLDYSFFVGKENGTGINEAPGGGSTPFRSQLKILSELIHSLNLKKVSPAKDLIYGSPGILSSALHDGSGGYLIYLIAAGKANSRIKMNIKPGSYSIQMISPITGEIKDLGVQQISVSDFILTVNLIEGEQAIRIIRQ
ncbi:MAG: hypothetical protein P8O16_15350 [Algoriphagus sp.]|uniref:hypothetical protein n=1 Tax=Algoriphagus sp. TaxID=1872435 RepID=UPI0026185FC7|nr:hypothetical protein [Algoriphagus sp.]MDG1278657.1 hypothetical protein [Algoriphagus sp.]